MPTAEVRQAVLLSSGEISIVTLDERFAPYSHHPPKIENICGYFTQYVDTSPFQPVVETRSSGFGHKQELFHLDGNVTVYHGRASFMGAQSTAGLTRLARTLRLEGGCYTVHMVVICMKLGQRAHVSSNGLLETNISRWTRHIRVHGRILEQANIVRFRIQEFTGEFQFPSELAPENNDWAVTGRGTVLARMTWHKLPWSQETEDLVMDLAKRVGAWLAECCGELRPRSPQPEATLPTGMHGFE